MTKVVVESNQKTITDPLMEPYHIILDQYGYTVQETITPDERYTTSGKTYTKPVGFYSQLVSCLETIAKHKTNSKSYSTLKEYIKEYKQIAESIKEAVKL